MSTDQLEALFQRLGLQMGGQGGAEGDAREKPKVLDEVSLEGIVGLIKKIAESGKSI